jgi:hypothetical protein
MDDMFSHTRNPEWIALREAEWQEHVEYRLKQDGYTKGQIQAVKDFSFSGDIATLLQKLKRKKFPFLMSELLQYAPFNKRAEFDFVVQYYCENYLAHHVSEGLIKLDIAKGELASYLVRLLYRLENPFIGRMFSTEVINMLFGHEYRDQKIEYPVEFAIVGKPEISINPNTLIQDLLPRFRDYLFDKERHKNYAEYKTMVNYCLSLFPHIDTYPFTLKLLENKYYGDKFDYDPCLNQGTFRMFFANIYGYTHDYNEEGEFGFFDPELQEYMKSKIEGMNLGSEYNAMIDMIHRHKGKVLFVSE